MFGCKYDILHTRCLCNTGPVVCLKLCRIESLIKVVIDLDGGRAFVGALGIRIGARPADFLASQRHRTVVDEHSEPRVRPPAQPLLDWTGCTAGGRFDIPGQRRYAEPRQQTETQAHGEFATMYGPGSHLLELIVPPFIGV